MRLLTDFQSGEPEVDIQGETVGACLIEDGAAAVVVGELPKAPYQFLGALCRSDRITEGDPAAPRHLIHYKSVAVVAEEQTLITSQRGIGDGQIRVRDDAARLREIFGVCHLGFRPRRL